MSDASRDKLAGVGRELNDVIAESPLNARSDGCFVPSFERPVGHRRDVHIQPNPM